MAEQQQVKKGKYGIDLDEQALSVLKEVEGDPTLEDCVCRDIWELQKANKMYQKLQNNVVDKNREIVDFYNVNLDSDQIQNLNDDSELEQIRQKRIQELKSNCKSQYDEFEFEFVNEQQKLINLISCKQKLLVITLGNFFSSDQSNQNFDLQFEQNIKKMVHSIQNLVVVKTTGIIFENTMGEISKIQFSSQDQQMICFLNGIIKGQIKIDKSEQNWFQISNLLNEYLGDEEENCSGDSEDEWNQPCAQCGRTFPHEHIKDFRAED